LKLCRLFFSNPKWENLLVKESLKYLEKNYQEADKNAEGNLNA
jgi:hypothetical protein